MKRVLEVMKDPNWISLALYFPGGREEAGEFLCTNVGENVVNKTTYGTQNKN